MLLLHRHELRSTAVCREVVRVLDTALDMSEPSSSQGTHHTWSSFQELVIYGLGSIEDSRVSRYQLAMAVLLSKRLAGLQAPPLLFDPAFTNLDAAILAKLEMRVIAEDEECRRHAAVPTFFYLPHCEGALCDNLLSANWTASGLSRVAILGNSFRTYQERWSMPSSMQNTSRPERLLQLVEKGAVDEYPVKDFNFHVTSAFNDMSFHVFSETRLLAAGLPP